MAKKTLLEMTQSILSSMDSDDVNSITDTIESLQVVSIIKDVYYELIDLMEIESHRELIQLDSGVVGKPTHMKLPVNVKEVLSVRYDVKDKASDSAEYQTIHYLFPEDFLNHINYRDGNATNVDEITDDSGVTLHIYNDQRPIYWTSFDDEYLVFDNYDSSLDSTLQNSKTEVFANVEPTWSETDTFIPDLPVDSFSLLLEEARSSCFAQLKQVPDQKSEQRAKRQRAKMSRKNFRAHSSTRYPDYGRKGPSGRTYVKDPTFRRN